MSSFTAWFMTGRVRMSMISSTSITSISGVVLMSQIASPSPLWPTDIDMVGYLLRGSANLRLVADAFRQRGGVRLGDEPDLHDSATLDRVQHTPHRLKERVLVRT